MCGHVGERRARLLLSLQTICSLLEVAGHCCSALLLPRFSCRLQARQFDEEINFTSSEGLEGMRVFYIEPELFFVLSLLTLFMAVSRPTSKFGLRHCIFSAR